MLRGHLYVSVDTNLDFVNFVPAFRAVARSIFEVKDINPAISKALNDYLSQEDRQVRFYLKEENQMI